MADEDKGKISSLPQVSALEGGEFVEMIKPLPGGGFRNVRIPANKLGGGSAGAGNTGLVYIVDINPINPADNVGSKVKTADNHTLISCMTSTTLVSVTVEAVAGPSAFTPNVTLNGNVPVIMTRVGIDGILFRGTANIDLSALGAAPYIVTVEHGDGGEDTALITVDAAPVVVLASITNGYPVGQTEVKAGDTLSVTFSADSYVMEYEIANAGAFIGKSGVLTPGIAHTVHGVIVADRGVITQDLGFQIRVKKASGTWSTWYDTQSIDPQVDGTTAVKLSNRYPTIVMGAINYPNGKQALDNGDSAVLNHTVTDANGYTYSSPNGQLTIVSPNAYAVAKLVTHLSGGYNDNTNNLTLVARRTANGATSTASTLVKLATVLPQISVTTPAARLRSGGNDGTAPQSHLITITSNQSLMEAPSLNAPEGTWSGSWVGNATKKVWTRNLIIHDNDDKGVFSFNSLVAKTISAKVQNSLQAGGDYTVGGFVFRTLTVPAYPVREITFGAQVSNTAKLRCTNLSKGSSGSLNFAYQADQTNALNRFTITNGNTWYNCDGANATSNTGGTMQVELEEVI